MAFRTRNVFLDSSALIAAAISARGSARTLINQGLQGKCTLIISSNVIEECERNLRAKMPAALPIFTAFIDLLSNRAEPMHAAVLRVAEIIEAKDAPIVAAAVAAKAEYLAAYDRKHLLAKKAAISEAFGITVATPDEILAFLGV
jgi:predicted nucleic acid-binding protein